MENKIFGDDDDDDNQIGIGIGIGDLQIPQDVLIQILVLLPVISLLRFKSVCKSWRALIQSPLFIHLHLNTSNNTFNNNFGTFIFQTSEAISLRERKGKAFMLSAAAAAAAAGGGEGGDDDHHHHHLKLEDLGFPPRYKVFRRKYDIFMVGSCNGLICIHDTKQREISLWNPATRQFRLLPESLSLAGIGIIDDDLMYTDFVAFGYDVQTKDYKVVQISFLKPYNMSDDPCIMYSEYIYRVQVYSLSTDSWRLLDGINDFPAFPYQRSGCNHGVYLNGSYYFQGLNLVDIQEHMILSFDFTKEIFTTIQPPPCGYHLRMIITSLGEKLAIFANMVTNESSCFDAYDIWVLLNEHRVKEEEESWTKLHLFRLNYIECNYGGTPRSISNNGKFALIYNDGDTDHSFLQLFNLVTKQVEKEFRIDTVTRAEVYKQSLVSVGGNDATTDRVIGRC